MKRYFLTSAVLLLAASLFSTWRTGCHDSCAWATVSFGLPAFLTTPVIPESGQSPEFSLAKLLVNVVWNALGTGVLWMTLETVKRWQDRRRLPPNP